ncbi:MAG: helix-turn-helix transcriptional regulator [Achromobacter sp.]|uniref:winged helix-turn-helix transcriptional regulator n=1 Tax=Achromobacter sp. TaxID=134375 RepID=UPI002587E2A7|nr:helix-turn-helix domain-containing protein [Achromobacter sp.]MCW0209034.1 helix-turn-helix transcriptional regulator [Achromobacter sp.]
MEKVLGLKAAKKPAKAKGRVANLMERGNVFAPACPSREIMKHVTSSWGVLVLIALQDGTLRFSELRRKVAGVSERMLAQTLQWLESDGLVERRAFKVVPPHVEYELTPMGVEAASHVAALADWIEENLGRMRAAG